MVISICAFEMIFRFGSFQLQKTLGEQSSNIYFEVLPQNLVKFLYSVEMLPSVIYFLQLFAEKVLKICNHQCLVIKCYLICHEYFSPYLLLVWIVSRTISLLEVCFIPLLNCHIVRSCCPVSVIATIATLCPKYIRSWTKVGQLCCFTLGLVYSFFHYITPFAVH